jgi:uncharacterized caspase-like protein
MKSLLEERLEFKVFLFTEDSAPIAAESRDIRTNPSNTNIRVFLDKQFSNEAPLLKAEDNIWFFFSGHGIRHNNIDYLMLWDSNPGTPESTAISVDYIRQKLQRSGAGNVILFLDACRSKSKGFKGKSGTNPCPGVITFYSCKENETSSEIESDINQGSFTYTLLTSLRGESNPPCITASHFDEHLREQVPKLNEKYGQASQTPESVIHPNNKNLILLHEFTTEEGILRLKNQAFEAKDKENWDLAEKLFKRVLELKNGKDLQAEEAIKRLGGRNKEPIKKTLQKVTAADLPKSTLPRKIRSIFSFLVSVTSSYRWLILLGLAFLGLYIAFLLHPPITEEVKFISYGETTVTSQ